MWIILGSFFLSSNTAFRSVADHLFHDQCLLYVTCLRLKYLFCISNVADFDAAAKQTDDDEADSDQQHQTSRCDSTSNGNEFYFCSFT